MLLAADVLPRGVGLRVAETSLVAIQADRERSIERIVNIGRLGGTAVCVVQFGLLGGGQPAGVSEGGLVIGALFLLLAAYSRRRLTASPDLAALRSLTLTTLVADTTLLAGLTLLLAHEADPLNLLILVFAVLEAAMKRQFAGAVSVAVVVAGVQVVRLLLATHLRDVGFDVVQLSYFSGLVLIMAVFAGGSSRLMAQAQEHLAISNDRLEATHELLRVGLASFAQGAGLQAVVRQAVDGLGLDGVVVDRGDVRVAWPPDAPAPSWAVLSQAAEQAGELTPVLVAGPDQTMWTVTPVRDVVGGEPTIVAGRVAGTQGLADLLAVQAEIQALLRAQRAVDLEESVRVQARRLDELRREFMAITHHEMRTPVTIIRSAIDVLGPDADPAIADRVHPALRRATERLERLIDDLTIIQRLDAGGLGVRRRPVDVAAAIGTALASRVGAAQEVRTSLDPAAVVLADDDLLVRIVRCLLDNALTHGLGRDVEVAARRLQDRVVVDISDAGPGVPREARQRIFERFTAADVTRHARGAGLGLPLARDLARLMDGDVVLVDDTRTVFRVDLPLAESALG